MVYLSNETNRGESLEDSPLKIILETIYLLTLNKRAVIGLDDCHYSKDITSFVFVNNVDDFFQEDCVK